MVLHPLRGITHRLTETQKGTDQYKQVYARKQRHLELEPKWLEPKWQPEFVHNFLERKMKEHSVLFQRNPAVEDPQPAWLLLSMCVSTRATPCREGAHWLPMVHERHPTSDSDHGARDGRVFNSILLAIIEQAGVLGEEGFRSSTGVWRSRGASEDQHFCDVDLEGVHRLEVVVRH